MNFSHTTTHRSLVTLLGLFVVGAGIAFSLGAFLGDARVADADTCNAAHDLVPVGGGSWHPGPNSEIDIDTTAGTAFIRVRNISETCSYTVNLASYKIYDSIGDPGYITNQTLHDVKTKVIGPGEAKSFTVSVPSCNFQVDVFEGPIVPQTNPDFAHPPLAGVDRLFVWESNYDGGVCPVPPPPVCEPNVSAHLVPADGGSWHPGPNSEIDVSGNTATLRVKNISTLCTYTVNLATYEIHAGIGEPDFISSQVLFDSATVIIGPGQVKTLVADVPACNFQADGFEGPIVPQTNPDFAHPPLAGVDRLFVWKSAFDRGTCEGTQPEPATLKLVKTVINDDGGTATPNDFNLRAQRGVQTYSYTSGQTRTLPVGTYTAQETNLPGYTAGSWTGDCAANGTVTLHAGDHKVCYITNNDKPVIITPPAYLTLVKVVINDDGGIATPNDFNLRAQKDDTVYPYTSGQKRELPVGTYAAKETNLPGYTAGVWTGDCAANGVVTLAPGDNKVCRITNNDIPATERPATLRIIKTVINDDGGNATPDDFSFFIQTSPSGTGTPAVHDSVYTLPAGNYFVGEEQFAGYTSGVWHGDCSPAQGGLGKVTLKPGDNKVCRITNNDIPKTDETPFCTLSVSPTGIKNGESATLSWTSGHIASASIDQGIGAIALPSGSTSVSPTATTTYTGTFVATNGTTLTCAATLGVTGIPQCIIPLFPSDVYQASGTIGQSFSFTIPQPSGTSPLTVVASSLPSWLSVNGSTISGTPTETGTFDVQLEAENECGTAKAKLVITISTPGCTTCGGSFPPKVVLFGQPEDNPLVLSSFVYLAQVPYTGFGTSALQVILFVLGLGVLAALVAYGALTLHPLRRLRNVLRAFILEGVVRAEAPVAHTNTSSASPRRPEPAPQQPPTPPEIMKVATPVASHAPMARDTYDDVPVDAVMTVKLTRTIVERAKNELAILSEDAGRLIAETADGVSAKADSMLSDVLAVAKTRYPRENGWLILDTARVRESLFVSFLSMVPLFVQWIIAGENKKVFAFLRLLKRQRQPVGDFVQKVVSDLGTVHRARLEGALEGVVDSELVTVVYDLSNSELEGMIHDLLSGVDETYESSYTAVRLALVRILDRMRARMNRTVRGPYEFNGDVRDEVSSQA